MKITFFLSIVLIVLFANYTFQNGGVLFVNQIWGNSDTLEVQIEDAIIDDNELKIDFIVELGTGGVTVEESNFKDGSVIIPINLDVGEVGTVEGLLNANGGILADADADDIDFSFRVENDSGDTTINGVLHANGGITADNGVFTVSDITGETTIADALLRPDGGIDVQDGRFTVDNVDGNVFTEGELQVALDIILGSNIAESRTLTRQLANSPIGGATHIHGQDAPRRGGDIAIIPGVGPTLGDIIFGRAQPDDLYIGRGVVNGGNGGTTSITGQDSDIAVGGDIIIASGNASGGTAGNIILSPGTGDLAGIIYLGSETNPEQDLLVTRPFNVNNAGAGSTTFRGQNAGNSGNGGDLRLESGDATSGGAPGDLYLVPGDAGAGSTGDIILGEDRADDLLITRIAVNSVGGSTTFHGQDSTLANGGDFIIEAGNGFNRGGDIYLTTGKSGAANTPGEIVWGLFDSNLVVSRPQAQNGAATSTTLSGQSSVNGAGGDFTLVSGSGTANSGDLLLSVSNAANSSNGGDVAITAGNGSVAAGDVSILAGNVIGGGAGAGGNVVINAGSSTGTIGDITFQTGTGLTGGDIVFGPNASNVRVELIPLRIQNGDLFVETDDFQVLLAADQNNILSISNDNFASSRTMLKAPSTVANVQLPPAGGAISGICDANLAQNIAQISATVLDLVNALSTCGHGLIDITDATGNPLPYNNLSGSLVDAMGNPILAACGAGTFVRSIARPAAGPL